MEGIKSFVVFNNRSFVLLHSLYGCIRLYDTSTGIPDKYIIIKGYVAVVITSTILPQKNQVLTLFPFRKKTGNNRQFLRSRILGKYGVPPGAPRLHVKTRPPLLPVLPTEPAVRRGRRRFGNRLKPSTHTMA